MKKWWIILLLTGFLSDQIDAQTVVILHPVKDATGISSSPNLNTGDWEGLMASNGYADPQNPTDITRFLIEFDLSSIPSNVYIESAILTLKGHEHLRIPYNPNACSIFPNLSPWMEDEVSWNNLPLYSSEDSALISSTPTGHTYRSQMADISVITRKWVSKELENNGLTIRLSAENGKANVFQHFKSRESDPAILTVSYYPCTCISISPTKDAFITAHFATTNFGNYPDIVASSWTSDCAWGNTRSLIAADLTAIPPNSYIASAELQLFGHISPTNGGHASMWGSNATNILMNTDSWGEATLTWNNAPEFTNRFQLTSPDKSSRGVNDLILSNFSFVSMVQFWVNNPSANHGITIQLEDESFKYRKVVFASSDNVNKALRPVLKVCYYATSDYSNTYSSIKHKVTRSKLSVYPNPNTGSFTLKISHHDSAPGKVEVFSDRGTIIFETDVYTHETLVNIGNVANGIYFIRYTNQRQELTQRFVVKQ